ncbi:MAG: hypothetical protein K8F91_01190 [Candidatus Obscuribacterales bacterium]|nr:hypothetical protein [Candidatus Obscuribacterales bacterium]
MKFAKIVLFFAGIYGILTIAPFYFMKSFILDNAQKLVNHPEFFYGVLGVTLSWQIAFLIIATDPIRFRLLM